jgi:hypothetical protein
MALRSAHGAARRGGRVVMVETLPADELPSANGPGPVRDDRDSAGRFKPGNSMARQARARAGQQGELAKLEASADPSWKSADRWSRQWAAYRRGELARLHGGELSSEVCALVEDARQAMRDARWCASKGASLEGTDPAESRLLRGEARQLRIEARGHRLAAWEIAAKEAHARPKADPLAWLRDDPKPAPALRAAPAAPSEPAPTAEGQPATAVDQRETEAK